MCWHMHVVQMFADFEIFLLDYKRQSSLFFSWKKQNLTVSSVGRS